MSIHNQNIIVRETPLDKVCLAMQAELERRGVGFTVDDRFCYVEGVRDRARSV